MEDALLRGATRADIVWDLAHGYLTYPEVPDEIRALRAVLDGEETITLGMDGEIYPGFYDADLNNQRRRLKEKLVGPAPSPRALRRRFLEDCRSWRWWHRLERTAHMQRLISTSR